jgi:hypothetical protein
MLHVDVRTRTEIEELIRDRGSARVTQASQAISKPLRKCF